MGLRLGAWVALSFALGMTGCAPASSPMEPHASSAVVSSTELAPPASAVVVVPPPAPTAEALGSASASAAPASPPSSATLVEKESKDCRLPASRPPETTIRYTRYQLPIGGDPTFEGVEVHAEVDCPATGGPRSSLPRMPCKRVTPKVLDDLYKIIRDAGFQRWRHKSGATSPHYGARTIEIVLPNELCRFSDATATPIAEDSTKGFRVSADAIVGI